MGIPIHVLGKTVFKLKQSPGYNQFHHSKETTMTIQMFPLGNLFENDYLHNSVWVTASIQNKSHISIEIPLWRWNDLMILSYFVHTIGFPSLGRQHLFIESGFEYQWVGASSQSNVFSPYLTGPKAMCLQLPSWLVCVCGCGLPCLALSGSQGHTSI